MDGGGPRVSTMRRIGNALNKAFTWFAYGLVACILAGWALLVILGNFVWDKDDAGDAKPLPSATSASTPISWYLHDRRCRDGSGSSAIGRRGACSHHGGVVTYFISSVGSLTTTCPPRYQPRTLERARALKDTMGNVGCDFDRP